MTCAELYDAALAADRALGRELQLVYGKAAGDARYDARGKATPRLRALSDAKKAADAAWRDTLSPRN